MNKKQLIVAWVTGFIIVCIILFTPQFKMNEKLGILYQYTPFYYAADELKPNIDLGMILKYSIPVFIFGGLLIYTLRDKKK